MNHPREALSLRWIVRAIIALAAVLAVSRILSVQDTYGESPFHSANDRSRWCTIAALCSDQTYAIDRFLEKRNVQGNRRPWYTIDLVLHRGTDGKQYFFSSKPPLLPTMLAGLTKGIEVVTGSTLENDTFYVARTLLLLVNFLPLLALWLATGHWLLKQSCDMWTVVILMVTATLGCFLFTFSSTLNNHSPGAICAAATLAGLLKIFDKPTSNVWWYFLIGLFAAFAAANELPALGWAVIVAVVVALIDWRRFAVAFVPAALIVGVAFFGTNYMAHQTLKPAYGHRHVGERISQVTVNDVSMEAIPSDLLIAELNKFEFDVSNHAFIRPARRENTWELWDPQTEQRIALKPLNVDEGQRTIELYQWDDWYDYPGSYWTRERKRGVDLGEESIVVYAFHALLGHHGVLSLSPIWIFSLLGFVYLVRSEWTKRLGKSSGDQAWWLQRIHPSLTPHMVLALSIALITLVTLLFYLTRPLEDRNYGGVTSGLRWMFWLIPLWFWLLTIALQHIQSNRTRRIVEVCLLISIYSAVTPWVNPWTTPWLMRYWQYLGWL